MNNSLKPDTQERMRSLCREISVAHKLDPEIQEELYGHMEDKLLAYLSGEEPVMEEDAFILVREHFGDPAAVKELMNDVHVFEAQGSLMRRIGAALIATLAAAQVSQVAAAAATYALIRNQEPLAKFWTQQGIGGGSQVLTIALLFLVLLHYQRVLDAGGKPWFLTMRPAYFVALATVMFVIANVVATAVAVPIDASIVAANPLTHRQTMLALFFLFGLSAMECVVWLWWCDRSPRRRFAIGNAAGAWVLMQSLYIPGLLNVDELVHLATSPDYLLSMLRAGAFMVGASVMLAVMAVGLYLGGMAAFRARNKSAAAIN